MMTTLPEVETSNWQLATGNTSKKMNRSILQYSFHFGGSNSLAFFHSIFLNILCLFFLLLKMSDSCCKCGCKNKLICSATALEQVSIRNIKEVDNFNRIRLVFVNR